MFSVGQKIVCINDDFSNLKDEVSLKYVILPKKGETYTIREITSLGLTLEEIVNKKFNFLAHNNLVTEPKFSSRRFVPLQHDFKKIEFSMAIEAVESSAN
jgi:hypothetical protein